MKFNANFLLILSLIIFQLGFSQSKPISKPEIRKKISDARQALSDLNCEKSLLLAEEALKEAHVLNDNELLAKSYNVIASNFVEFSDTNKAKDYFFKSLHHANLADNDTIKDWVYNNLGAVYAYYENNFEKGIEYYKNLIETGQRAKKPDHLKKKK